MLFFDQHDIISQVKLRSELHKLQDDKQYYKDEVSGTKSDLDDLLTNPSRLEKFAREKYLMKREDEDVFIIVREAADAKSK
jgi:cell division protein FtsB